MVSVSPRHALRLSVAAALLLSARAVCAQDAPASAAAPANLAAPASTTAPAAPSPAPVADSPADLAPMPDLGVDWPDPAKIDAVPAAGPTEVKGIAADRLQRYRVILEGADPLGSAFKTRFDQLSALVANQGKPANAAQINRRARDDEELVRQLLAAQGHYDGRVVATVVSTPDRGETVVHMTVTASDTYRFDAVALPGLDAAGVQAPVLAKKFAVKQGDIVDADAVLAAVTAFKIELGHDGYPFAKVGEPQVAIDHQLNKAVLTLPVTPGPRARFGRIVPTGPKRTFSAAHLATIARFPSRRAI